MALLIGQLDELDVKPVSYQTPKGLFVGKGFSSEGEPQYKKVQQKGDKFHDPITLTLDDEGDEVLDNMFKFFPLDLANRGVVGFSHKLSESEKAEKVIAYNKNSFLDPKSEEIQKLIIQYKDILVPSNMFGITNFDLNSIPQSFIKIKKSNITLVSLILPIMPTPSREIFKLDKITAQRIVQKNVKTLLTQRMFNSLVGCAMLLSESDFISNKGVQSLNAGTYNQFPTLLLTEVDELVDSQEYSYFLTMMQYYTFLRV